MFVMHSSDYYVSLPHLLLVNFPHAPDHFSDAEGCSHAVSGELEFPQTRVALLLAAVSISPSSSSVFTGFFANLIKYSFSKGEKL